MKYKYAARVGNDNSTLVYATTKVELEKKSLDLARKHIGKEVDNFEWKGGAWVSCGTEVIYDPQAPR